MSANGSNMTGTAQRMAGDTLRETRSFLGEAGQSVSAYMGGSLANVWRIAGKELTGFFSAPIGYIFIGAFLALCLFIFFWVEQFFARNIADVRPLFSWMPLLLVFLTAALTMRMWSEERRAGTLEFLMTAPIKPVHLVLGKFLGCMALVSIALVLTLPIPLTVASVGPLDWGPVIGGYVAALFLAAAYIAIGLFVSARTQSQIVALIVSVLICGAFYLIGSDQIAGLFGNQAAEFVRLFGTGSRFASIERGVIDLRDIYYYLSIFGVFFVLNLWALETLRWSGHGRETQHRAWLSVAGLVVANLVAGNLWLSQVSGARADLTEGSVYSISETTEGTLRQIEEPMLIRGYFSAQTHPLLAPLVPRLRDLLTEYEVASDGRLRVEIVDPAENQTLEEEAGRRFGIRPVPLQTSNRYQASVTNSYFDIAVIYGDTFQVLGFRELIEVNATGEGDIDVALRNPEYDITRTIKKVLADYRGGGSVFDGLDRPLRLSAFVSPDETLPEPLPELRKGLDELIADYQKAGGANFTGSIAVPGTDGAPSDAQLQQSLGLRPLAAGLFNPVRFWFHIVLDDGQNRQEVALPETLDKDSLKRVIDAEIKRFTPGAVRTVALHTPPPETRMNQFGQPQQSGPTFRALEQQLGQNANVVQAPLTGGRIPEAAEALFVVDPRKLDDTQVFAIDQFLMRGGTVVVSTASFRPDLSANLSVQPAQSGLDGWLANYGVTIPNRLVLDPQNTPFPVPVTRDVGGYQIRETQLLRYPPFIDLRGDAFAGGNTPVAGIEQMTLPWTAPIVMTAAGASDASGDAASDADANADGQAASGAAASDLRVTRLIETSAGSWTIAPTTLVPDIQRYPERGFPSAAEEAASNATQSEAEAAAAGPATGRQLVGVMLEGAFKSFFAGKDNPLANASKEASNGASNDAGETAANGDGDAEAPQVVAPVIESAPESARLIVISSATLFSDDAIELVASVDRSRYLAPLLFAENIYDWSLEDGGLRELRNRPGQFARTLLPISQGRRAFLEYLNYALALAGLGLVYALYRWHRQGVVARSQRIMQAT